MEHNEVKIEEQKTTSRIPKRYARTLTEALREERTYILQRAPKTQETIHFILRFCEEANVEQKQ